MKFWVTLEGRDAEVEFHTEGDRLLLEVDGRRIEADFHAPAGRRGVLAAGGRPLARGARVARRGDALEVTLRGTRVPVEVRHPLEKMLQAALRSARRRARGETIARRCRGWWWRCG